MVLRAFRTTRVMVMAGTGAGVFDITRSAFGWSCARLALIADMRDQTEVDQARASVSRVPRPGVMCVVVPAGSVHSRPMAMSAAVFRSARDEVMRSVDRLLPIEPAGAGLGFVNRSTDAGADTEDDAGAGFLLAVDSATVRAARELSERVLGGPPSRTVAPQQALLGMGLHAAGSRVRERGAFGEPLDTLLDGGLITELRVDASGPESVDFALPTEVSAETSSDLERLAIGAAICDRFASEDAEPLHGSWSPIRSRVYPGVLAAVACAALVLSAWSIREGRYRSAIERVLSEQEAIAQQVRSVEREETELGRLVADLGAAQLAAPVLGDDEDGSGALAVLDAVLDALPAEAFLESVTVDGTGVRLRGIALSARQVLGSLESAAAFENARESDRPRPLGDGSGRETFSVVAAFARRAGGSDER
jgi:hypothetical protein